MLLRNISCTFNGRSKVSITNIRLENNDYIAEFSSRYGGNCYRLFHKQSGKELLRSPANEEKLNEEIYLYGNPILFPPNRTRGGKFTFEGREYVFPVNEPQTGCHLHGELFRTPFSVEKHTQNDVWFSYTAKAGEYLSFPHAFALKRRYILQDDGLHEWVDVCNRSGQNMPFMLAFHTTLCLWDTDSATLRMPVGREQLRDKNYLPTLEYAGGREREQSLIDGTFAIGKNAVSALYESTGLRAELSCTSEKRKLVYQADEQYAYRMLWRRDGADFVAIEPQTCAIDCFHLEKSAQEKGLIIIAAGETVTLHTRLYME